MQALERGRRRAKPPALAPRGGERLPEPRRLAGCRRPRRRRRRRRRYAAARARVAAPRQNGLARCRWSNWSTAGRGAARRRNRGSSWPARALAARRGQPRARAPPRGGCAHRARRDTAAVGAAAQRARTAAPPPRRSFRHRGRRRGGGAARLPVRRGAAARARGGGGGGRGRAGGMNAPSARAVVRWGAWRDGQSLTKTGHKLSCGAGGRRPCARRTRRAARPLSCRCSPCRPSAPVPGRRVRPCGALGLCID